MAQAPQGRLPVAAYLMDQVAMLSQGVGQKINLADYRISLPDLEKVARIRLAPILHEGTPL